METTKHNNLLHWTLVIHQINNLFTIRKKKKDTIFFILLLFLLIVTIARQRCFQWFNLKGMMIILFHVLGNLTIHKKMNKEILPCHICMLFLCILKPVLGKETKGEKMQYWHHKRGTNCTIISKIRSCNCHFSQGIKCKRLPNKHQNDIGYSSQYMNINNQHTTEKYYTLNLYLQENNNTPQPLIHTLIKKKSLF